MIANKTVTLSPFPQGMNNIQKESKLPEGSLRSAINVDITDDGSIRRRKQFSRIYTGTSIANLYKRYFTEGGVLKYLESDNTATVVNSNIISSDIAYCEMNNGIYYTDGNKVFNPNHEPVGLEKPTFFNVSDTTGALRNGKYQISICHINLVTGELSGATNPIILDVVSGGISLTDISIPSGEYATNVYISDTNGADIYFHTTLPNGQQSLTITVIKQNKHLVQTLDMSPIPGGSIIQSYNGRLYVAKDEVLWYSQPHRYGLHKQSSDFLLFAKPITVVQPVDDGLYIVADKTYFISGNDPSQQQLREVSNLQGIEGTGITLDASYFSLEYKGKVAYWFSDKGGVIGLPSGQIQEFSKDRLAVPTDLQKGSTMYVEENGIHKIVSSIGTSGSGLNNSIGASDNATATLIRNGNVVL